MPQENDISDLLKFAAGILSLAAVFTLAAFLGYSLIRGELGQELQFLQAKISEAWETMRVKIGY